MKHFIRKTTLLFSLFLSVVTYGLYAAELNNQSLTQDKDNILALTRSERKLLITGYCRENGVSENLWYLFIYFVHDYPFQYKNKRIPKDLSYQDVSGFDFTGCKFVGINLTGTKLKNAILDDTTCDYEVLFESNWEKYQSINDKIKLINIEFPYNGKLLNLAEDNPFAWYYLSLKKEIFNINKIYPTLQNSEKLKLLHVASGICKLPQLTERKFNINMKYFYAFLLQLKNKVGSKEQKQLICSSSVMQNIINYVADHYCWKIINKKPIMNEVKYTGTDNYFDFSIKKIQNRYNFINYDPSSDEEKRSGSLYYLKNIKKGIQSLKECYNQFNRNDKKKAKKIADKLCQSYRYEKLDFLVHYLECQIQMMYLGINSGKLIQYDDNARIMCSNPFKILY